MIVLVVSQRTCKGRMNSAFLIEKLMKDAIEIEFGLGKCRRVAVRYREPEKCCDQNGSLDDSHTLLFHIPLKGSTEVRFSRCSIEDILTASGSQRNMSPLNQRSLTCRSEPGDSTGMKQTDENMD